MAQAYIITHCQLFSHHFQRLGWKTYSLWRNNTLLYYTHAISLAIQGCDTGVQYRGAMHIVVLKSCGTDHCLNQLNIYNNFKYTYMFQEWYIIYQFEVCAYSISAYNAITLKKENRFSLNYCINYLNMSLSNRMSLWSLNLPNSQDLKKLLFGSANQKFNNEWQQQAFTFCDIPGLQYGLIQKKVCIPSMVFFKVPFRNGRC